MKNRGSWFFEGYQGVYEEQPDGTKKKKLVYTGEYYGFRAGPEKLRQVKRTCLALTLATIAANLLDQFLPSAGGMFHLLAIPSLISLVPMIYMVIGLFNLLTAKEKWEIRVYYAGYRRLYRAGVVYLVCVAAWLILELYYIVMNPGGILGELRFLLVLILCIAAQAAQLVFIKRNPAWAIEGPTIR